MQYYNNKLKIETLYKYKAVICNFFLHSSPNTGVYIVKSLLRLKTSSCPIKYNRERNVSDHVRFGQGTLLFYVYMKSYIYKNHVASSVSQKSCSA